MFKKSYLLLMFLSAWLCGITLQAQERLWVVQDNGGLVTMDTDGWDSFYLEEFKEPTFGTNIVGFSVVKNSPQYNGQVIFSTDYGHEGDGNMYGSLSRLGPNGLSKIYDFTYLQNVVAPGIAEGLNGIYMSTYWFSKWAGIRKIGYSGAENIFVKPNTDFSKEYKLTTVGDTIFGVSSGDSNNEGFVYRITPDQLPSNAAPTRIYAFTGGTNGARPTGRLQHSNGILFGETLKGGLNNKGVFFKVSTDGTGFKKLFDLATTNLTKEDANGKFQTLLDAIAEGYVPATGQDGNYFVFDDNGIYKVNPSGDLIAKIHGNAVSRIELVSPQFQHNVKLKDIANGAKNIPTELDASLTSFTGATMYQVQYSTSPDFTGFVGEQQSDTPVTHFSLLPNTTYYARVRTNLWPYYGEVVSFTTVDTNAAVPDRLYAYNGTEHFSVRTDDGGDYQYFRKGEGDEKISSFIPLSSGERIFVTSESLSDGSSGTMFKISGANESILYSMDGYHTGLNKGQVVDGHDGYVYALEYSTVGVQLGWITRFKTDGSKMQRSKTPHSGIQRYVQITGTPAGIYGVSSGQGANNGFLFRFKNDFSGIDEIFSFAGGTSGTRPKAAVILGRDGFLYGTARAGGLNNAGVIYKVSTSGTQYTVLHHFNPINGKNPETALIQDANGTLFGSTTLGGKNGFGVLFKIEEDGSGFKKLIDYYTTGGKNADGSLGVDQEFVYATGGIGLFKIKKDGTDYLEFGIPAISFKQLPVTPTDLAIVSPAAGETTARDIVVTTTPGSGSAELEICASPAFEIGVMKFQGERKFNVSGLTFGQMYYARVRSWTSSAYSPVSYFRVGDLLENTIVIDPADGAVDVGETVNQYEVNVSFTVKDIQNASIYWLQVCENDVFDYPFIDMMLMDGWRSTNLDLNSRSTYYVRVRTDLSPFWGPVTTFVTKHTQLLEENANIDVYPNPSARSFTLKEQSDAPIRKITITDLSGNVLYENDAIKEGETFGEDLKKGIYILTLQSKDGVRTVRLVKE